MRVSGMIDSIRELCLAPARGRKDLFLRENHEIRDEYGRTRSSLEDLLRNTEFYHGTGRLQYVHDGDSKYEGVQANVQNTFASIVQNGLVPKYDPFAKGMCRERISLTQNRMYARVYAGMFAHQKEDVLFEYGSRAFWWSSILARMATKTLTDWNEIKRIVDFVQPKSDLLKQCSQWTQSFSKDKVGPMKALFSVMAYGMSDIAENHSLIFAIKKDAVSTFPLDSAAASLYESRTKNIIEPGAINHIEVPLSFIADRRQEMKELGFDIPLIPMEFIEMILSERHFSELIAVKK